MRYIWVLLLFSFCMNAQDAYQVSSPRNTSLNLILGPNVTYSSTPESFSIGGNWGVGLDHIFPEQPYGFSVDVSYSLIHIGEQAEPFTPAAEATEFKVLETGLGFLYMPFDEFDNFKIKFGISQGLILSHNTFGLPGLNYNLLMGNFGLKYDLPSKTNLAASINWDYKYYRIYQDRFGFHITSLISVRLGLKT